MSAVRTASLSWGPEMAPASATPLARHSVGQRGDQLLERLRRIISCHNAACRLGE